MVGVLVFYNGDEEEGRKKFAKLIDLGPVVNATGMMPYELLNTMQNDAIPYGTNCHLTGTVRGTKPVEPQAAQDMFNRMLQIASAPGECSANGDPTTMIIWEFHHLKKAVGIPADATAFRMRVEYPSLPLVISWEGESDGATRDAKDRLGQLRQIVDENLKETFVGGKGVDVTGYGNYEPGNLQSMDAAATLYGANYPRLQELKRKYDPSILFRSWYPIQPSKVVA